MGMISGPRSLQNAPFCPISASHSNFNPQNTQCIPAVKIFAFLELEPRLNKKADLTGQAKMSIFQRSQDNFSSVVMSYLT
jgi:hypothetical protein